MSGRPDGIDVAHYQLDVDWQRVKAAGVFWAACKATQGVTYVDPKFERNRQGMTAAGFRHRFFYHWLSPKIDTLTQAAHYLKVVGPLDPGEGVLLDAEEDGITSAQALVWCQAVEKVTGRPVAIYTGAYIGTPKLWTDPKLFDGRRPRILAAYTSEAKAKALPGVAAHPWDAWQYTSTGTVDGVPNRVDCDQIDNVGIFDIACGRNLPEPLPDPEPSPYVQEDTVMYFSNSEPRPATNSSPGHAWFELMPGGRARIVADIADVQIALNSTQPETVTTVQRPNAWIDALLGKGAWVESSGPGTPAPRSFAGTLHLDAV